MVESQPPPPPEHPATGEWVWDGRQWWFTTPDGQRVLAPALPGQQPTPSRMTDTDRSSLRIVGAVIAFVCAAVAGWFGVSWLYGYMALEAEGNIFAVWLALFGLAALGVAAAFGITGVVLITKTRSSR